ncbi:WXG100 family type VII secretion target [Micromonospora sp. NPDC049366]|uniref:WXG100 family type VII secretion target n=1 Tax=Micromonospora sp. NPDC049366 TaxID=3364271 RepID=UPI00378E6907
MSGFEVVPESLREGGATIGGGAEAFQARLRSFQAELADFEGAWGDDTIGALIGTAYQAVSQWAFECLRAAAGDLVAAGTDLAAMADGYERVEESARALFAQLDGRLG